MVILHAPLQHHWRCFLRVKKERQAWAFRALMLNYGKGKGWVSVECSSAPFVDVDRSPTVLPQLLDNQYTV